MLRALDHIIIAVKDLDAAERSWAMLLGREAAWAGAHPDHGTANRIFRFGDFYLELMGAVSKGGYADRLNAFLEAHGEGIFGLCFATDDAERCADMFKRHAIAPIRIEAGAGRSEDGASDGVLREWRLVLPAREAVGDLFLFAIEHLTDPDALPIAPRQTHAVEDLDHLVIMTKEADKMKQILQQAMGIRLALDQDVPEWNVRQMFFRLSGKTIEVIEPRRAEDKDKPNRFWGLAWQVEDIEAAHHRLAELNSFDISEVRTGRKKGTRVFTVRNAPGNIPTLFISQDTR